MPERATACLALALALFLPLGLLAAEKELPRTLPSETLKAALPDLRGAVVHPLTPRKGAPATVLVFTSVDCPIANAYVPELLRIARTYGARGIRLTLVHADPALTTKEALTHAGEYGLDSPALLDIVIDRKHRLVKAVGATTTPEAAVLDASGALVYRGRINNFYADFGDKRATASEHDLRNTLDALLAGKPVPTPSTKTIGCIIEPLE